MEKRIRAGDQETRKKRKMGGGEKRKDREREGEAAPLSQFFGEWRFDSWQWDATRVPTSCGVRAKRQ
jgi:hypothetical protein